MQLHVQRTELITALTEKRDEIAAKLQKKVDRAQARYDEVATGASSPEEWLRKVADLLRDGHVRVEQDSGSVPRMTIGHPRNFITLNVVAAKKPRVGEDPLLPEFPGRNQREIVGRLSQLNAMKRALEQATGPYDAQLKILNMSKDEQVGIQDGDYGALLSGAPARKAVRQNLDWDTGDWDEDDEDDEDDD